MSMSGVECVCAVRHVNEHEWVVECMRAMGVPF